MQLKNSVGNAPPWNSPNDWQEINRCLSDAIRRHPTKSLRPRKLAQRIHKDLMRLGTLMADLCARTCLHCPDPCCLSAQVWLDFKDLLFLHLADGPIPDRQPIHRYKDVCRYWSAKGCRLPRISRPWICTWYRCPTQTARIRRRPKAAVYALDLMIRRIQTDRRTLEEFFIEMVT
jgi:hypothetical protein